MDRSTQLRDIFAILTILIVGTVSMANIGVIDAHSVMATGTILVPAVIVMGFLGQRIGEIIDNPKNKADADYKLAVLNALKKMDKSITLQELNEKLTKTVAEPDAPEPENEEDLDV